MTGAWILAALAAVLALSGARAGPVPQRPDLAQYTQVQLDEAEQRLQQARDALVRVRAAAEHPPHYGSRSRFCRGARNVQDCQLLWADSLSL